MRNLFEKIIESRNIKLGIYIITVFLFLMFFSQGTSFLYKTYGWDSSVFVYTGQMMVEGKQLYSELFDHKGPMIFIINAVGQLIYHGKAGIFLLQVINLTAVLGLIYLIANKILKSKKAAFFIPFIFLSFFLTTITDGNLTEEWSLAFILLPLYLFVKYILNLDNKIEHKPFNAMIYGVCFALVAFIRLNNVISIAAVILCITIILIRNKKFQNLFQNMIQFVIGVSIITIPIVIYFYLNNTLGLMLDASILYNVKYATANMDKDITIFDVIRDSKFIVPIFLSVLLYIKAINSELENKQLYLSNVLITVLTLITMLLGQNYEHYYTLALVPLMLNYILVFKLIKNMKYFKTTLSLILICTIIFLIPRYYDTYMGKKGMVSSLKHDEISMINTMIPEQEKDNVLIYDQFCNIAIYNEYKTKIKYFMLQRWMMNLDKNVRIEMLEYLTGNEKPNWIILDERSKRDDFIQNIIKHKYILKCDTGTYLIYQTIDQQILFNKKI